MIRHVVLLRWKKDADPELVERFKNGVFELRHQLPGVLRYSAGENIGLSAEGMAAENAYSDNYDFAVCADLEDYEAYQTYATHQNHQVWIEEVVRHILAERVAVQYDLEQYGLFEA